IASLGSARTRARDTARFSDMKTYQTAMTMALTDGHTMPNNVVFIVNPTTSSGTMYDFLVGNGYLSSLPYDKWNDASNSSEMYRICTRSTTDGTCNADSDPYTWAIRYRLE